MWSPRLRTLVLLLASTLGASCNCTGGGTADAGPIILTLQVRGGAGAVDLRQGTGAAAPVCDSSQEPCAVPVAAGPVTLLARPADGYDFVSWGCGGGAPTTSPSLALDIAGPLTCTATFKQQIRQRLDVVVQDGRGGSTGGVVTSQPLGVQCGTGGTACSLMVETNARVTLTAVADPFYTFSGWSGDCAGTAASVEVLVPDRRACTATFTRLRYPLSLSVTGVGTLAALLPDGGLLTSCALPSCPMATVDAPEVVALEATPGANRRVSAWTGDCAAAAAGTSSSVTMDAARACQVALVLVDRTLTVSRTGSGAGTVAADPAGTRPDGGSPTYPHGTAVKLTAAPDATSDFTGWQGDCTGTAATTTVTLDADRACTAVFTLKVRTLTVTASTHGAVTSTPAGIDTARSLSSAGFPHGTVVQLDAVPEAHYEAVFSGACSATGQVTMTANASCGVTFRLVKQTLTATPVGSGSVTSSPAGIDTKVGKLSAVYDWGTAVTLTATPNTGGSQISFVGWSGDCTGTSPTAVVTLDANRSCTASFTVTPYDLTVALSPAAGGSVTGKVGGVGANVISCGAGGTDCTEPQIPSDRSVTLVAVPATGYRFDRWSGCASDTTATLVVPMTSAKSCTAGFIKQWTVTLATLTGPGTVVLDRSSTGAGADRTCSAGACSQLVDQNETVTVTAAPANGTTIIEAFTCSAGTLAGAVYTLVNPAADVTCNVTFHQRYTVAVSVSGAGGTVASAPAGINACTTAGGTCSALFLSGDTVVLTATPAVNNQVAWTATAGGVCDGTISAGSGQAQLLTLAGLGGNKACTAAFTAIPVTVNGRAGVNGTVVPLSTTVTSGGPGTILTATPNANHHLTGWSGAFSAGTGTASGCSGTSAAVTVAVAGATPGAVYDCTASFAVNTVTVNGASGGNGTVSPASTPGVAVGSPALTLTAAPAANYHLTGWSGAFTSGTGTATGCSGAAGSVAVAIAAASDGAVYTCTASFALNTVTVNGKAVGNGTVGPATAVVTVGAAGIALGATPAASHHLVGWSGAFTSGSGTAAGCSGSSATVAVTISAATDGAVYDCTATFAVNTVTVSGAAGANGTVAPASTPGVAVGSPATTLTATPAASFHVAGWSGAFTAGSGTATGCSGSAPSVGVAITAASDGAVYTCTATFAINTVTLLGSSGGSGTVAPASTGGVAVGAAPVTLTASAAPNFHLASWSGAFTSGTGTATGCTGSGPTVAVAFTAASDGAVYECTATFSVNLVTVNGRAGPNGAVAPASTIASSGGAGVTLTATAAANYHLVAWTGSFSSGSGTATGCGGAGVAVTVAISGATPGAVYDCTATFAINGATIAGVSGGNGTVGPASTATTVGAPATTLTAAPAANYHLVSWSGAFTSGTGTATGCAGVTAAVAVTITGATDGAVYTCTATFALNAITLAGAASGSGAVAPASTVVTVLTPATTLTATPAANQHLVAWSGAFTSGTGTATGCSGSAPTVAVAVSAGSDGAVYTCTATFALNTVTVAGRSGGNGTVAPASTAVGVGTGTVTLLATPAASYHFTVWTGAFTSGSGTVVGCTGGGISTAVSFTAGSDGATFDCTGNFAINNVTITASAGPNGTAGPASTATTVGAAPVTLTAAADPNHHLAAWSGSFTTGSGTATGCSGASPTAAVVVTGATEGASYDCHATFAINDVVINGLSGGNGTVGPATTASTVGAAATTLTATPAANYHLVGWSGAFASGSGTASGCSGSAPTVQVAVSAASQGAAYDCTATFALNTVTVNGASGGNGTVSPASTPGVAVGSPALTLTAAPAANYHLTGWSGAFTSGTGTATGCTGTGPTVAVAITAASDGAVYDCTATFAVNSVTIAGAAGANGSVAPASTVVTVGAPATTLTATPAANYHLASWTGSFTTGSGAATGCSGSAAAVAVAITSGTQGAVFTCTASFALNTVTVAGAAGGDGSVAPATAAVTVGGAATLTATPGASSHLASWSGAFTSGTGTATGCSGSAAAVSVAVSAGSDGAVYTCTATFVPNDVTIAGASSGSGSVAPASTVTTVGAAATTLTATPGASAHLASWSGAFTTGSGAATGCTGSAPSVSVAVTSGTQGAVYTCTATFVPNDVTVAGAAAGDGSVAPTSTTTTVGAAATTLTATPGASAHLTGWSGAFTSGSGTATGCSGSAGAVSVAVTSGTQGAVYTCTATFAPNDVTVAGAATGSGSVAPASTTTTVGAAATTLTATPGASAHLASWSGAFTTGTGTATGCSGSAGAVSVAVTAGSQGAVYTCTATFVPNDVTVAGAVAGSGSVAPASTATTVGAAATTLTATPGASAHLTGWSGAFTSGSGTATGCSGSAGAVSVAVTSGTQGAVYTCTATFAPNDVTLAGAAAGDGSVAPASTATTVGAAATTLTATPGSSAHLTGWSGTFTTGSGTATGCSGSAASVAVAVTAGTQGAVYTCTATFAPNNVTLTGNGAGNGSVSPPSTATTVGAAAVTLTGTPGSSSYHLASWSGSFTTGSGTATGCSGTGTSVAVAITAATEGAVYACVASFSVNTATLAGSAGANGSVAPASTPGIAVGSPATTLTATPASNYHVSGWAGLFTTGSGTATGCSGTATTAAVAITGASDGAVYTCTASFALNTVTLTGSAGPGGTVAPASTVVTVGAAATTLTATPAADQHVAGWSGAFLSGTGTATGCSGTGLTAAVAITAASDGAVYDCTATFATNTVTLAGAAGANGSVAPASTGVTVGAAATTLTATPAASFHLAGWSGSFTTGSGTATGCSGSGLSVAVAISSGTQGAVYTCTATFAVNTVTLTGSAAGGGGVAPASTVVAVGAAATTLTATPGSNQHLVGWSGAFTTGSGTATGCSGTGPSVAVAISAASDGAVYDCTATFATNTVTIAGAADPGGTVAPASTVVAVGAAATTLTATPDTGFVLAAWSGAFTAGTGTATGCDGTLDTTSVTITSGSDGAVYTCTASFAAGVVALTAGVHPQATVTVQVVPAPAEGTTFGLVTSPCEVAAGASSCTAAVEVGSTVTLATAEATAAPGGPASRFVRWVCSGGAGATTRSASVTITGDTTCVAQYYGLWARALASGASREDALPEVAALAPGSAAGLPSAPSTFLLDAEDGPGAARAAWVAGAEQVVPTLTDRASPRQGAAAGRLLWGGGDAPGFAGLDVPSPGRTRGLSGGFSVGRTAAGAVSSLTRGAWSEWYYPDPGPAGGTSSTSDTAFLGGRESPAHLRALAGYRALTVSSAAGQGPSVITSHQAWVVVADAAANALAWGSFAFPGQVAGSACSSPLDTTARDVLWDPDPANPGGLVVVGDYREVAGCVQGQACPPDPGLQRRAGFVAKLDASLGVLALRALAPASGQPFTAQVVAGNLGQDGYLVFGQYGGGALGLVELSLDLGTVPLQRAYQVADPASGLAPTTLADALVDRSGSRYLALTSAVVTGARSEVVVLSFDAAGRPIAGDGWRFGTAGLDQTAHRLLQAPEGGFLLTGQGPLEAGGLRRAWVARTDERFGVPLSGAVPGLVRTTPVAAGGAVDLALGGGAFRCAGGWVDLTRPSQAPLLTPPLAFTPQVTVQGP